MPQSFNASDWEPIEDSDMSDWQPIDENQYISLKKDPTMWERFKAGFMGKEMPQPKGFEKGDIAELAGSTGLETIGGTVGGIIGGAGGAVAAPLTFGASIPTGAIAGTGYGAAAGKALHEGIRRSIGAFKPGSTDMGTNLGVVGRVAGEGLLQATGAKYLPIATKAVGKGLAATGKFIGKKVLSPILRGTSGISKRAFDALINDSKAILENVGMTADDIATKGQDLQGMISYGKEGIETSSRKVLSRRQDDLVKAGEKISEHANFLKTKAVEYGQELQSKIGTIKEKAGAEYKSAIDSILGNKSLKYGLDPGAAYPYTVDMKKPLMNTIKSVREKFGYNLPGRVSDETEAAIFNKFQNVINNMDNASVDEVYWLQRDLRHAMDLNKGKPISAALGNLRSKVLEVLEEKVPEIAPANKAYRSAMELADEMSSLENADILSNQIHQAFKYGGNKRDALLQFGSVDKEANKAIENIVKTMDDYTSLVAKGKEVGNLATKIGDLSATYKLGESKNLMLKLAEKDPTIKSFLANSGKQEEVYKNLGNLLEGDNISKQIVKIMSEGGNKKDSLMELARTNPDIGSKISEIQNAIFGKEFSPWFRDIPQTGFGRGILFGGGAMAATIPSTLVAAPLFSPRLIGLGTNAVMKGTGSVEKALANKTLGTIGKYAIPGTISSTEMLMRKYNKK